MTDKRGSWTFGEKILLSILVVLLIYVAWAQLTAHCGDCQGGMKELFPPSLPTPEASLCTTEWNKIDNSFLGQRVCVRGSLHAVDTFNSYFGTRSHPLYLLRPVGSMTLREGDCIMAGGIVMSDGAHPLYIQADRIGLCPLNVPAWWPFGH